MQSQYPFALHSTAAPCVSGIGSLLTHRGWPCGVHPVTTKLPVLPTVMTRLEHLALLAVLFGAL